MRVVRAYVVAAAAGALDGSAHGVDLEDVDLTVSELATNATRYSASGLPGGGVSVRVLAAVGGVRVEIEDDGGAQTRPEIRAADGENWDEKGRGLLMVDALSDSWGYSVRDGRVTVWCEFL